MVKMLALALPLWSLLLVSSSAYTPLSDATIRKLPQVITADFDIYDKQGLLAPILIPRVPGTPGSASVRQHFADYFHHNLPEWQIGYQNSTSTTPTSNGEQVPFVNMIMTRDPPWVKSVGNVGRLVLVAHYDSKLSPTGFIGAIDSAAPCAMLLHTARAIDDALTKKWNAMSAAGVTDYELEDAKGVQILLLDGEEAFIDWTSTDSIYGARSLAAEWESTVHPATSTFRTPLESMELFVLLDLLGAANPSIPSYFKTTHWAYQHMADVEQRLDNAGLLKVKRKRPFLYERDKPDSSMWYGGQIGDDHVPFQDRGVEVLHIIPLQFPAVWHKMTDDGEHLDLDTVMDWATITTAFAAEFMELDGHFSGKWKPKPRRASHDRSEL